jgi:hypothetical protein
MQCRKVASNADLAGAGGAASVLRFPSLNPQAIDSCRLLWGWKKNEIPLKLGKGMYRQSIAEGNLTRCASTS